MKKGIPPNSTRWDAEVDDEMLYRHSRRVGRDRRDMKRSSPFHSPIIFFALPLPHATCKHVPCLPQKFWDNFASLT
jgi:hypothetical protein